MAKFRRNMYASALQSGSLVAEIEMENDSAE